MFSLKATSSLEKILPGRTCEAEELSTFSVLTGETASLQFAFADDCPNIYHFRLTMPENAEAYFVKNVPVGLPTFADAAGDPNYISHDPGLYPDLLVPVDRDWVQVNEFYQAIWVRIKDVRADCTVAISFETEAGEPKGDACVKITAVPAELPKQELIYTQWFHSDCIYTYYQCEIFSERHWELLEKFLRTAHENGVNMILTPVFTPPLDTAVGTERPTAQLLRIEKEGDTYRFDFTLLRRWITLCKEIGFTYFEMPHLFTQWGAKATPKILAWENGALQRIFGWDCPADSPKYDHFLSQFLPALIGLLREEQIDQNTYFHISDEPWEDQVESYQVAKRIASKYLVGCKIIDALSEFSYYERGVVETPIPCTDKIAPFLEADLPERWCYYCCCQDKGVSNRFVSMPSSRNRSIGVQLFKYRMNGFLHWGYNFYYSRFSKLRLNPFCETDAYGCFPSGDSFSVYPGKDGPWPAIGLFVFQEALQDLRALKLLETDIGHEKTVALIEETLGETVSFDHCYTAKSLLRLRERVNETIAFLAEKTED